MRYWNGTSLSATVGQRFDSSIWSNNHNHGGNLGYTDGHSKYQLKSAIPFTAFGVDPNGTCSGNGVSALGSTLHMLAGDADNTNHVVDNRQQIQCPLLF